MHAKCLDTVLPQQLLLAAVHIPQADVHQLVLVDDVLILQPPEDILLVLPGQPGQEGHGHAVDVSAGAHLRRVDIGMRIDPDNRHFPAQSLPDGLGRAGDSADGDRVVAA